MVSNSVLYFLIFLTPVIFALDKYVTQHSGLKMPILGYGTFQVFLTDYYDIFITSSKMETALENALDAGYRHIDTASVYNNEETIGRVLKFLNKSLAKLQVDYVDLYLIHSPDGLNYQEGTLFPKIPEGNPDVDNNTDHLRIWKAMEDQVSAGLTKSIGLSNYDIPLIDKILKNCTIQPDNLQIKLHAYFQQNDLVDYCKEHNISVTAYSPFGGPAGLAQFSPGSIAPNLLDDPIVTKIAKKHDKSPAQVLLRHIIQKGIATIPKSTVESSIIENFNIFDFELDDKDMEELNSLDKGPASRIDFDGYPE